MTQIDYYVDLNRLTDEYNAECLRLGEKALDPAFRSPRLAERADEIVALLDEAADELRSRAARWRGEN
ncbi:hypothetical protein ACFWY9_29680 [Amycolatopsis sp. NPDC059027]|uniref:hypothetical protein n=1 Tax=Amycolatopsis sp. NPDC059027 TaxID=3346709 RepID=UPI003670B4D7